MKQKILFEISQIDKLLGESKPLIDLCKIKNPDFIEISAAAMVLHSFYNGIESIIILILKYYNEELPKGIRWHSDLLEKAFRTTEKRKVIFETDLQMIIEEYMRFRHFARHMYNFKLEWSRMENLFNNITSYWQKIKENIIRFIENNEEAEKKETK